MRKIKGEILYVIIVFMIGFINWSISYWTNDINLIINLNITTTLIAIFYIAFLLFKGIDFVYSIPVVFALIFSIGVPNINLDHLGYSIIAYLGLLVLLGGLVFRIIKSKSKIKLNSLGLGLLLAAISIFIPFLYTGFNLNNLSISLLGFIYLAVYLMYSNLIKEGNIKFLMYSIMGASVLLLFQLGSHYFDQLTNYNDVDWYSKLVTLIREGWVGSFPGWGNINDLTIHLVLFSSAPVYFLSKNKNKIWPWLYLLLTGVMIYISLSRGSMVTFFVLFTILSFYTFKLKRHHKKFFRNYLITLGIMISLMLLATDIVMVIVGLLQRDLPNLIDFGNWDVLLTGRIEIYKTAINRWLDNPLYFLFGSGWYGDSSTIIVHENRILIYHSTFFQVIATGGVVGFGILVYHFKQVYHLFKKSKYKVFARAFLLTYLLTQIHGLIDNTQYMIHYMISVLIIFAVFEVKNTNDFEKNSKIEKTNTLKPFI